MGKAPLERNSGIALWRQIADSLRTELSQLADETGRLPPEPKLAERFNVNRLTLRAAVTALVEEGVLKRQQGRGTFIQKQKRLVYPISRHTRFSAGLAQQADERQVRFLSSTHEVANATTARRLKVMEGDLMERIETLSFADNVAVIRGTHWFPAKRFSGIGERIRHHKSITRAFLEFGVNDYTRQTTEIEAHLASRDDAKDLGLSPGAIILLADAINVDEQQNPVQLTKSRMAADRVTLRIHNELE